MYVAGSGIQLYMYKSDWPEMQLGNLIEITGTLSESKNESRIKLSSKDDIKILEKQTPPQPHLIITEQIGEEYEGNLIQVQGTIIEITGSKVYLQDEEGEAEIYLKRNTKIKKSNFTEGEEYKVTGIITQNNDIYQLWPRSTDDITKIHNIKQQPEITIKPNANKQNILKYLLAGAIFLSIGLVATTYYVKKSHPKDKTSGKG